MNSILKLFVTDETEDNNNENNEQENFSQISQLSEIPRPPLHKLILDMHPEVLPTFQRRQFCVRGGDQIFDSIDKLCEGIRNNDESLIEVDLSWMGVGDTGIMKIASSLMENHTMKCLKLAFNGITDSGIVALASVLLSNYSLKELDLNFNMVTDVGASSLASALRENDTLMVLVLSGNELSDVGAASLADMLRVNHTLNSLFVEGNNISKLGTSMFEGAQKEEEEEPVPYDYFGKSPRLSARKLMVRI